MAEPALSLTPATAAEDQYERLLARFATSGFPPLIVAVGLNDRLLYALERHNAPTRVLTLEPLGLLAQHATARPTWRSWIDAKRLTVLVGPEYTGYAEAWRLIARDALQPPMLVDPEMLEKYPAQTEAAKAVAKQIVRGARANEEARKRFAGGYLLNTLANLPAIASEGDAAALHDLFSDVPAIVIGAGPSLDSNLADLHRLQDRALLIVVDTAVRPLLAAGIHPHLVVSVDPSPDNARHLAGLADVRGLWFVGEGSLASTVFPQFAGRTFVFKVSNHDPWSWLASHGCDRTELKSWGSVLTTAFDLALATGCDPIVFAGADLAYTDGLQYCRNTVYEPEWSPFPTNAERAAKFAEYLATRPHGPQSDLRGGDVMTAPHFVQFRDWIVGRAESAPSRRIINGTGAGILHGGRLECEGLGSLAWPPRAGETGDLRQRLAEAWSRSTSTRSVVRADLARASAYGSPIPFEQWHEFARDSATNDQIRSAIQSAAGRLEFDCRKAEYLAGLSDSYDRRIVTLDDARDLSHGNYDIAANRATAQQTLVFLDYLQRTYEPHHANLTAVLHAISDLPRSIRALDVGCGVGRLMVPLAEAGVRVDGVDISEGMIQWARASRQLQASAFFPSRGNDCGEAPDGAYDLVYSQLCFRYLRSRTVRNELLQAMARALRPGGIVMVEMRFFSQLQAAAIPSPHVAWSADCFEVAETPTAADVCPTPDELHLVYSDFSRYFEDIKFQFVDMPTSARDRLPQQLFVSGSVCGNLASRIHALRPVAQSDHDA